MYELQQVHPLPNSITCTQQSHHMLIFSIHVYLNTLCSPVSILIVQDMLFYGLLLVCC